MMPRVGVGSDSRRLGTAQAHCSRILSFIAFALAVLATLGIAAIMALTVLDVSARYVVGRPMHGLPEYAEVTLVFSVFLALPFAYLRGNHISVTLLVDRVRRRLRMAILTIGAVISTATLTWMLWSSLQVAIRSVSSGEFRFGMARVPMWPSRVAICVGLLVWILMILSDLGRDQEERSSARGGE